MLLDLINRVRIDLTLDASEALACKFGAELGQHPTGAGAGAGAGDRRGDVADGSGDVDQFGPPSRLSLQVRDALLLRVHLRGASMPVAVGDFDHGAELLYHIWYCTSRSRGPTLLSSVQYCNM